MYLFVFVLSLAAGTLGQQPAWGQCGGSGMYQPQWQMAARKLTLIIPGWNGRTDCVKGYVCQIQNPWYSKC